MDQNIKNFMADLQKDWKTIAANYDAFERDPNLSIVRLLRYEEPRKAPNKKLAGPIQSLLMPDDKGNYVEKEKAGIGVRILPTVLVLKAGVSAQESHDIQDGDLRMVPPSMVVGMARNPDFIDVHEAQIKNEVVVKSNIPEQLPANMVYWGRHRFVNPFADASKELSLEDMYTFIIPSAFILNRINVDKVNLG